MEQYLKPGLTPAPPVSVGLSPLLSPALIVLPLRTPLRRCAPGFTRPIVVAARDVVRTIGALPRSAGLPVSDEICITVRNENVLSINNLAFAVYSQAFGDGFSATGRRIAGFQVYRLARELALGLR